MFRPGPRARRTPSLSALRRLLLAALATWLLASPEAVAGPAPKAKPPPKVTAETLPPSMVHGPIAAAIEGDPVRFEARISDPSGILAPSVQWRLSGQKDWATVPLELSGKDTYTATLAAGIVTREFEYYVEAYDNLGNGPARAGDPTNPLTVPLQKKVIVKPPAPPPPPPPPPAPSGPLLAPARYAPVAVAGVGLALLIGGLVAYSDAAATAEELNARYTWGIGLTSADHAVARAASTQGLLGSSLALAGGVTLAGGLGWYLVPLFVGHAGSGGDGLQAGIRSQF